MPQYTDDFRPIDTISGFSVRPGLYEEFGARLIPGGVSFTLHSQEAASCELLLFHHNESEPYAKIPSRTVTGSGMSIPSSCST